MKTLIDKMIDKIRNKYEKFQLHLFTRNLGEFGKRSHIKMPCCFEGKESIFIGEDVTIAAFVHIWGHGGVKIGKRVMIASNTSITSLTHDYTAKSMRFSPIIAKQIVIEDDVWIGANAVILPGLKIGTGAVVGAGSVVTKDVPPFAIVSGVPAIIRSYRKNLTA